MKKKSAVNSVGESKTLKAAVTPKKASNKIEWTSSKSSVAAVSDKGVVTGKKAGTAKITAKAADGSGKKATVKVTVNDVTNMSALDVQNVQTVTFSLDKPQALAADGIFIKTKKYAGGEYRKQLNIESVSTLDNINYSIVLKRDSRVHLHEYVQVSVPSLTGKVKSMEKEYVEQTCAFTNEEISVWVMNKYNRESFTFGNACGYASYTITGLPAGLSADAEGDFMYVKGTPTAAGSTTATLSAVDEKGNTLTKSIYFIVGSGDVIAGAAMPEYSLVSNLYDYIN
ncbi:MAG: Ig-like domain-containing protein, partial [Lachnospiraceae bacterium]|nr:Ig-like domain-containing protein [Lachnospiraceae bacterium]